MNHNHKQQLACLDRKIDDTDSRYVRAALEWEYDALLLHLAENPQHDHEGGTR